MSESELSDTWRLLTDVTSWLHRLVDDVASAADITAPEFTVLTALAGTADGRAPMTAVAAASNFTSGGFTKVADRMVQEGLLEREPSGRDRRVVYAVLTERGRATARAARETQLTVLREHLGNTLGPARAGELREMCAALCGVALPGDGGTVTGARHRR